MSMILRITYQRLLLHPVVRGLTDESGVLTTPVRFAAITDASSGQQAFFQVSASLGLFVKQSCGYIML